MKTFARSTHSLYTNEHHYTVVDVITIYRIMFTLCKVISPVAKQLHESYKKHNMCGLLWNKLLDRMTKKGDIISCLLTFACNYWVYISHQYIYFLTF